MKIQRLLEATTFDDGHGSPHRPADGDAYLTRLMKIAAKGERVASTWALRVLLGLLERAR